MRGERGGTYYGWRIVAVAFLTHCLTVGCVFYSFGVFFTPLPARLDDLVRVRQCLLDEACKVILVRLLPVARVEPRLALLFGGRLRCCGRSSNRIGH